MNKIIHRRKICRGENAQAKRSSPGSIPSSSLGSELIVDDGIPGDKIQNQSAPVGGRKSFRSPPLGLQLYSWRRSRGGSGGKWGSMEFVRELDSA
jgi:hypothetical protein